MPLVEHLRELRNRLGTSLLAIAVCVVVIGFLFWEPVFDLLKAPYCDTPQGAASCQLFAFGPFEQFTVRLRVSFIAGTVISAPVWLYQFGAFVTPALHKKEKRYAGGFLAAALLLFAAGAALAYVTVSTGLEFLLNVGGDGITTLPSIQSYLSFVTLTLVAFGIAFEFPVVVMFLNMVGVFPATTMRSWRRGMVVALFALSAVITPSQDPFTFIFLALPLYALYEGCILLARLRERSRRRADPLATLDDDLPSQLDPPATQD